MMIPHTFSDKFKQKQFQTSPYYDAISNFKFPASNEKVSNESQTQREAVKKSKCDS